MYFFSCIFFFIYDAQSDCSKVATADESRLPSLSPSGLVYYDTKVTVMNRVLNATVQRTADHAAPEITLDPLEIVGGGPPRQPPLSQTPAVVKPRWGQTPFVVKPRCG